MAQAVLALFVVLGVWWVYLSPFSPPTDENQFSRYVWGASYQLIAILGGVWGLTVSRSWGGFRSVVGRSIGAFSLGLLFQAFGQSVYSFYNLFLKVEAPYPSLGDIGFFGSIPLYIYGALLLAKASGVAVSLRTFANKMQAVVIPLVLLVVSYLFFLKDYEFDFSNLLQVLLDFGYPLGQALYVAFAILTFLLSRRTLGGMMKGPVLLLIVALLAQYVADYNFLFQFSRESWYVGGYGDFLYLFAYLTMALSLIRQRQAFRELAAA